MLNELADFTSVEDAAEAMAGNWQDWSHFVWFGSDDYPESDKIMLGYLTGPDSGTTALANAEVVSEVLKPYLGMADDPSKTVDEFKSNFHGDKDALKGYMVRVYDSNGQITEAFQKLYELGERYHDHPILDQDVYDRVNRREITRYVAGELPYLCKNNNLIYNEAMVESVVSILLEDEADLDTLSDAEILIAARDVSEGDLKEKMFQRMADRPALVDELRDRLENDPIVDMD